VPLLSTLWWSGVLICNNRVALECPGPDADSGAEQERVRRVAQHPHQATKTIPTNGHVTTMPTGVAPAGAGVGELGSSVRLPPLTVEVPRRHTRTRAIIGDALLPAEHLSRAVSIPSVRARLDRDF
jgi:hypothetical protein